MMTDLQISNMLADYHKECDAAETLIEKGEVQLKHARLIRKALRQSIVNGYLECKCGQNSLPYKAHIEIYKCSRCGNDR